MTAIEVIKKGELQGNVFLLPPEQLDRKLYHDVNKLLEGITGQWNKKARGFVFSAHNFKELLDNLKEGEKRNLKKETQFFATPPDVAEYIANELYLEDGMTVLEPSAGQGALIEAVLFQLKKHVDIFWIEKSFDNQIALRKRYGPQIPNVYEFGSGWNHDFLHYDESTKFDRIIANPPFSKNQDIDHIRKMYACLAPKGRLVSIASTHWQLSSNKKEKEFAKWLDDMDAGIFDLGHGKFKSSGTMVNTCFIVIDKNG